MKKVRMGIVGLGNMGSAHAANILKGEVPRMELAAVCDLEAEKMEKYDDSVKKFSSSKKMIRSGEIDAILVATPHYDHTTIGIDALEQGLHVLVEKPVSVHKADAEKLIAAHKKRKQVFAAMFNQRTIPAHIKVKQLIDDGHLGKIQRINWIISTWFRSETYYASGGWRATWAGEGGGVLLNQCPHNLDLMQWFFGMPSKVAGYCSIGKYHNIEVEDEVTAYLEYPNGATGVFVTSTGETPGTNRLEIAGDQGRLVMEHGKITFKRNEIGTDTFNKTTETSFGVPDVWNIDIPVQGTNVQQHVAILRNFTDAVLDKKKLIAPAKEGIKSVELGNAMLFSTLVNKPVEMPMNGAAFERALKKLIKTSKFKKKNVKKVKVDMGTSF